MLVCSLRFVCKLRRLFFPYLLHRALLLFCCFHFELWEKFSSLRWNSGKDFPPRRLLCWFSVSVGLWRNFYLCRLFLMVGTSFRFEGSLGREEAPRLRNSVLILTKELCQDYINVLFCVLEWSHFCFRGWKVFYIFVGIMSRRKLIWERKHPPNCKHSA